MEFKEIKKIWDDQNQQPLYAINEAALHNRIREKQRGAEHISNFTELFIIIVNIAAPVIILISTFIKNSENIYIYVLVGLMIVTAGFVFAGRLQRKRRENAFDQSMLGDLDHAIANAAFQVMLSQIMRWSILPVGTLTVLALWQNQIQIWILFLILLFFGFTWLAGRWEHQMYVRKKRELKVLRTRLTEEGDGD